MAMTKTEQRYYERAVETANTLERENKNFKEKANNLKAYLQIKVDMLNIKMGTFATDEEIPKNLQNEFDTYSDLLNYVKRYF